MKKALYLILSATLVLGLVGCGCKAVTEEGVVEDEILEEVLEDEDKKDSEADADTDIDTDVETEDADSAVTETTEENAEEDTTESEAEITVTDYSATMYANTSANVRAGNGTDYDVIGTLSLNTEVTITGKCDNGWYQIEYNGSVGYVSGKVVSEVKTEVGSATVTTDDGSATTATTSDASSSTTSTEETTTDLEAGGNTYTDAIKNFDENNVVEMVYNKLTAQGLTYDSSLNSKSANKSVTFEANSGCFVADGKSFSTMEEMANYLAQFISSGATSEFYIITTEYGTTGGMSVGGTLYGCNKYLIISLWWN